MFEVAKELNRVKDSDSEKAGHLAFILRSLGEILGIAQQAPEAFLQGGFTAQLANQLSRRFNSTARCQ